VSLVEPEAVFQGDPVIGIGRPFAEKELPTPTWGLVTAGEREVEIAGAPAVAVFQVAYHRAEGAHGAPVFSLDGELLGIQAAAAVPGARDLRSQRTSSVVPAARIRELIEGGDREVLRERSRRRPEPPREKLKPSTFIEGLTHVDPPPALLTHHWRDAQRKNEAKETIPRLEEAASGSETFSSLAGRVAFLAPLRALVHRVDLVAPVNIKDLVSFPDAEDPEQGSEEKVGSEIA
jgi:hypothetical protein